MSPVFVESNFPIKGKARIDGLEGEVVLNSGQVRLAVGDRLDCEHRHTQVTVTVFYSDERLYGHTQEFVGVRATPRVKVSLEGVPGYIEGNRTAEIVHALPVASISDRGLAFEFDRKPAIRIRRIEST